MQGLAEMLAAIAVIGAALVMIVVTPGLALVAVLGVLGLIAYGLYCFVLDLFHVFREAEHPEVVTIEPGATAPDVMDP